MSTVAKPPVIPMNIPASSYLIDFVKFVVDELSHRLVPDEAQLYVHLMSPNRSVFKVSIQDDGTITSELIQSPP